jgi:hypothetical protein
MADNTELNPGSGGDIYAADDVSGVKFQRIKVSLGADGEYDGDVSDDRPMPVHDEDAYLLLLRLLNALRSPAGFDRSLDRQRNTAIIESGTVTTVTTVTTCATVTNLSQIDTLQGRLLVINQNVSAWHSCVRSRIS